MNVVRCFVEEVGSNEKWWKCWGLWIGRLFFVWWIVWVDLRNVVMGEIFGFRLFKNGVENGFWVGIVIKG